MVAGLSPVDQEYQHVVPPRCASGVRSSATYVHVSGIMSSKPDLAEGLRSRSPRTRTSRPLPSPEACRFSPIASILHLVDRLLKSQVYLRRVGRVVH